MQDIDEIIERDDKTWKEQRRIGTVEHDPETGTICFYRQPDDDTEDYFYWLPLDEMLNYEGYNRWFEHMSHKMWFNDEVKHNLVDVVDRIFMERNIDIWSQDAV